MEREREGTLKTNLRGNFCHDSFSIFLRLADFVENNTVSLISL